MKTIVVSNTGPLIHLAKLEKLGILRELYGVIFITKGVFEEAVIRGKERGYKDALLIEKAVNGEWIVVIPHKPNYNINIRGIAYGLNRGEIEAISLALLAGGLLLIDEKKGRMFARELGIKVLGTIGIIIQATKRNIIPKDEGVKALERLLEIMYVSHNLIEYAKRRILECK